MREKTVFITLEAIQKTCGRGEAGIAALRGISLRIAQNEFPAPMEASRPGRSTLMNLSGCLDRPDTGPYWLNGRGTGALSINERTPVRNQKIGMVRARPRVIYGNRNWVPSYICGISPEFLDVSKWNLTEGERRGVRVVPPGPEDFQAGSHEYTAM